MTLADMVTNLNLERATPELIDREQSVVTGGHASDMLSDVLAYAPAGAVLVTVQTHLNVVAVAVNTDLAAVIFAGGRQPDDDTRVRAVQEKLPLYTAADATFDVAGRLYALGVRGANT